MSGHKDYNYFSELDFIRDRIYRHNKSETSTKVVCQFLIGEMAVFPTIVVFPTLS